MGLGCYWAWGRFRPFKRETRRPQKVSFVAIIFNPPLALPVPQLAVPKGLRRPLLARRVKDLSPTPLLKTGLVDIRLFPKGNQPNGFATSFGGSVGTGRLQPIGSF